MNKFKKMCQKKFKISLPGVKGVTNQGQTSFRSKQRKMVFNAQNHGCKRFWVKPVKLGVKNNVRKFS